MVYIQLMYVMNQLVYAVTPKTIKRDSACIAMTRALGDFYAQSFGLSHEPDIIIKKLKK